MTAIIIVCLAVLDAVCILTVIEAIRSAPLVEFPHDNPARRLLGRRE
jgi:hypothetical protein